MARQKKTQSKHDVEVRRLANQYKKQGYEVQADVSGFSKPETFGGYRPDVIAKNDRERKIIEVETIDSVGSTRDLKQQRAFKQVANRSKKTSFSRKIVK